MGGVFGLGRLMAIYRVFKQRVFDPEAVACMAKAYEGALVALKVSDRDDPFTQDIARKIVQLAESGDLNPDLLRDRTVEALSQKKL
jgi:hypothetical protein